MKPLRAPMSAIDARSAATRVLTASKVRHTTLRPPKSPLILLHLMNGSSGKTRNALRFLAKTMKAERQRHEFTSSVSSGFSLPAYRDVTDILASSGSISSRWPMSR